MRVAPIQTSFNAGEFSPLLDGRVDFEQYKNALKTCLNCVPLIQGPVVRRPGTYFSDESKDSSKTCRAVAFRYSTTQAYILEFGNNYIRFKRNNAPVTEAAKTITAITQANPAVVTSAAHGFSNGDMVDIVSVVGMTQLNNRRFTVAGVAANTFQLSGLDSTGFTAYVSGGTASRVYEIATGYAEADIPSLRFTQSADVMYITHPAYKPRQLSRTAHTAWTLADTSFTDGPYLSLNNTTTTITPSAVTGAGITLTASAPLFTLVTDVNRYVRIKHVVATVTTWGYAKITAVASTTSATATVLSDFSATTASGAWRLGAWSDTTGYPACSTFFNDRLWYGGGGLAISQTVFGSKTSSYADFTPSGTDGVVAADNSISETLNSNDVQSIYWMLGDDRALLIGTESGEWVVRAASAAEALSAISVSAKQNSSNGSLNDQAVRAGSGMLFVQAGGRSIREMGFTYVEDRYGVPDMILLSEHITRGGVSKMAFQRKPHSLIWAIRGDGALIGFTYERDQKVLAWHRHIIGGASTAGGANAVVESIATIPSASGDVDELWLVVKRYVDGGVKRYFEYMTAFWENGDDQADAFFVDCGLQYSGAATSVVTGAYHLRGQTVKILIDGAAHPDVVVSATGSVTLNRTGTKIAIGEGYNSDGQTLRFEAGAKNGTAQGKTQRTHYVNFRMLDSLGLSVGPDFDHLERVNFRTSGMATGAPPDLFTGDKAVEWDGDYTTENLICWRWDEPFPGTILAIMPQMDTYDG